MNYYYTKEDQKKRQIESALSASLMGIFKYGTSVLTLKNAYIDNLVKYYRRTELAILKTELPDDKDLITNITDSNESMWLRLAVIKSDIILNNLHDKQNDIDDDNEFRKYYNDHIRHFISPTEINNAAQKTKQTLLTYLVLSGEAPKATKMWLTREDDRVRPAHVAANLQKVPWDSTFNVGGESLFYPCDETASPDNVINCRCVMVIEY